MNGAFSKVGIAAGVVAFAFCLAAGLWILTKCGFDHGNDAISTAIGLYFIGKAFFVGPMLIIASLQPRKV